MSKDVNTWQEFVKLHVASLPVATRGPGKAGQAVLAHPLDHRNGLCSGPRCSHSTSVPQAM